MNLRLACTAILLGSPGAAAQDTLSAVSNVSAVDSGASTQGCGRGVPGMVLVVEAASPAVAGEEVLEAARRVAQAARGAVAGRGAADLGRASEGVPDHARLDDDGAASSGDARLRIRLRPGDGAATWAVTARIAECGAAEVLEGPPGAWRRAEALRKAIGAPSARWAVEATGLLGEDWVPAEPSEDECRGNMHALKDYYALMGDLSEEKSLLVSRRTGFSWASIWRLGTGRLLVLDGIVMSDTRDEHIYHEMLVHPALLAADAAADVLVVGGGEGATLREVLRGSAVRSATMVEIDEGLVGLCHEHLGEMHQGSFNASRSAVRFEDGAAYLRTAPEAAFDVVIVDGVDFYAEEEKSFGNVLFQPGLYQDAFRALRPGGVLVQYMSHVERGPAMLEAGFDETVSFTVDVPSFFGAGARFTLAGKGLQESLADRLRRRVEEASEVSAGAWAYLSPSTLEQGLEHKERRLKGFYYGGSTYNTYGYWGHSRRVGYADFNHMDAAYVAWILTHSRRRYGTWVSEPDACSYNTQAAAAIPADGGGAELPADGAVPVTDAEKVVTDGGQLVTQSALPASLCEQAGVPGGMEECAKCDACLDMTCVNGIVGCEAFLSKLYQGCMQDTNLVSDVVGAIFTGIFCCCGAVFLLVALADKCKKSSGFRGGGSRRLQEYQMQREAMQSDVSGGVTGELEFEGSYTESTGDNENATYSLNIGPNGVFNGVCHDADGLQEVSGKIQWPIGHPSGTICWVESRAGVQTESRGQMYRETTGVIAIEAQYVSTYDGETTGAVSLRSRQRR